MTDPLPDTRIKSGQEWLTEEEIDGLVSAWRYGCSCICTELEMRIAAQLRHALAHKGDAERARSEGYADGVEAAARIFEYLGDSQAERLCRALLPAPPSDTTGGGDAPGA